MLDKRGPHVHTSSVQDLLGLVGDKKKEYFLVI